MNSKIFTATLTAAALAGLIAGSPAQAQSYGGAPECGFGHSWDPNTQSCVSNRGYRTDYSRRSYTRRVQHTRHAAHRTPAVRLAHKGDRVHSIRP
jgi:hypothetical protein